MHVVIAPYMVRVFHTINSTNTTTQANGDDRCSLTCNYIKVSGEKSDNTIMTLHDDRKANR